MGRGAELEAGPEMVGPALLGSVACGSVRPMGETFSMSCLRWKVWRRHELSPFLLRDLEAGGAFTWPLLAQDARSLGLQVREQAVPLADSGREAAAAGARLPQAPGCRTREASDSGEDDDGEERQEGEEGDSAASRTGSSRTAATWPRASGSTRLLASLAATRGAAASTSEVVPGDAEQYAWLLSCLLGLVVFIGMLGGVAVAVVVYNCRTAARRSHTRTMARLASSAPRTNGSSREMSTRGPGVREEGTEGGLRERVRREPVQDASTQTTASGVTWGLGSLVWVSPRGQCWHSSQFCQAFHATQALEKRPCLMCAGVQPR